MAGTIAAKSDAETTLGNLYYETGPGGSGIVLGSKILWGTADTATNVTSSTGLPVAQQGTWSVTAALAAAEAHVGEVGGNLSNVAVEMTRPADTTAYAANDVVSDSTSATTLQPVASFARVNQGTGFVVGAKLVTDKKSITPPFRVHLFNASNPTVAADNAAMKRTYADESKYIGSFDLPALSTPSDTSNSTLSEASDMTLCIPFQAAAGTRTIYWVLETLAAFTPASGQKFTLRLWGDCN